MKSFIKTICAFRFHFTGPTSQAVRNTPSWSVVVAKMFSLVHVDIVRGVRYSSLPAGCTTHS